MLCFVAYAQENQPSSQEKHVDALSQATVEHACAERGSASPTSAGGAATTRRNTRTGGDQPRGQAGHSDRTESAQEHPVAWHRQHQQHL